MIMWRRSGAVLLALVAVFVCVSASGADWAAEPGRYRGVFIGSDYGVLNVELYEGGGLAGEGSSAASGHSFVVQGEWFADGRCHFQGDDGRFFEGKLDSIGRLLGAWSWGVGKGSFSALVQ